MFRANRSRRGGACVLTFAVMLAAGMLTGCGESPLPTRDGPKPLSKREYVTRANELRAKASFGLDNPDGEPVDTSPERVKRNLAALQAQVAGMEQLEPPVEWRDQHEAIVESLRIMRDATKLVVEAPGDEDVYRRQSERMAEAQAVHDQARKEINASIRATQGR